MDELRQALVAKERPPEIRYLEHLFNMLVPTKHQNQKQEVWLDVNRGRVDAALKFTNVVSRVLFSPKYVSFNKLDSCNVSNRYSWWSSVFRTQLYEEPVYLLVARTYQNGDSGWGYRFNPFTKGDSMWSPQMLSTDERTADCIFMSIIICKDLQTHMLHLWNI